MDSQLTSVPIDEIQESATNPRRHFDERGLSELTESIREKGIVSPLLLRSVNSHYEIVAGARRYRAARALGLTEVPAIVRPMTDEQALEIQVIENLQRQDVHPLDEAEGYRRLVETTRYDAPALAVKVGKSVSYIYQRLALDSLIEPAKKAFWKDQLTAAHALLLARLQSEDQKKLLQYALHNTVRELQQEIEREVMCILDAVAFDKKDALLLEKAGACTVCPKRSGYNKELFADITTKDRCMDPDCFHGKIHEHLEQIQAEAAKRKVKLLRLSGDTWTNSRGLVRRADSWAQSEGWRPAKKGCPDPKEGLIVEDKGVGRVLEVCLNASCKVCNPKHEGSRSSGPGKQTPKARYERRMEIWENKVEQEARRVMVERLLPLIGHTIKSKPQTITRDQLVILVREVGGQSRRSVEDVGKLIGLKIREDAWDRFDLKDWQKDLAKASEPQLAQLLFGMILQQEMIVDPSLGAPDSSCLTTLVDAFGDNDVIPSFIRSEARKKLESVKPKPPKEPVKKTKSKKAKTIKREGK